MRSSIVIESEIETLLIDAGPDLRQQALRHGLKHVDYVFYTHSHLDHVAGFDELRAFCWRRDDLLPLYGNKGCMEDIQRMFSWAFTKENTYKGYIRPVAKIIEQKVQLKGLTVIPVPVDHGGVETSGYKLITNNGFSVVYICDVKVIPEASFPIIGNPDVLIIDCLREEMHQAHMCVDEVLAAIARIQPKQVYLTHCSHEMDCSLVSERLPANVQFCYDTQSISFS